MNGLCVYVLLLAMCLLYIINRCCAIASVRMCRKGGVEEWTDDWSTNTGVSIGQLLQPIVMFNIYPCAIHDIVCASAVCIKRICLVATVLQYCYWLY